MPCLPYIRLQDHYLYQQFSKFQLFAETTKNKESASVARNPERLPVRLSFIVAELFALQANEWVPRRKAETAKTLLEVREERDADELQRREEVGCFFVFCFFSLCLFYILLI